MSPILDEFLRDLERTERLVETLDLLKIFAGADDPDYVPIGDFFRQASEIHDKSKTSHADVVVLIGTLVLYLGGRFEFFIRAMFEDLCDQLVSKCEHYSDLPKEMRDSLIIMTAEVMISPRKYGHAEGGVKSFVQTLANNLADKEKLEAVNSKCLSITNENMKAEVLGDLFKRIGAKDIWEHIGRQARILALFETRDATQATSKARTILDEFMRQRNQIAHPSATISWANPTQVKSYITFFRELCITLVEVSEIYKKPPPKPVVKVT